MRILDKNNSQTKEQTMSQYRDNLPQLGTETFITDGGLETTLLFHHDIDLPCFAAFDLLKDEHGETLIGEYLRRYAAIATRHGTGFILESPTWRANRDWGEQLGYSTEALSAINRKSIAQLSTLRDELEQGAIKVVISGCVGPRGDGYSADQRMSAAEAESYHAEQIGTFSDTAADLVSALTITYSDEATGITRAAQAAGMPVAISFTVETDGRLPSGETIGDAIKTVDAATNNGPVYYMINCAHPSHFKGALATNAAWLKRIRGIRANASTMSHAELDECETLDDGNPAELGEEYSQLVRDLPNLTVLGGCCGTDHRHIESICTACH